MRNQIGIFYSNLHDTYPNCNADELLQKAHDFGYDYVEIDYSELTNQNSDFFKKLRNLNMIPSVYVFTDWDCNLNSGKNITEVLPELHEMGIGNLMLVCGSQTLTDNNREEAESRIVNSVNKICKEAEKLNISILFEDFGSHKIPCGNTEDLIRFTKKISDLKVTFDTGNFSFFDEDPVESYEKLKDKIGHCHVKDNYPNGNCTVTGEGTQPIKQLLKMLVSGGYTGRFSIEMFGVELNDEKFIKAFEYAKNAVEEC